MSLRGRLQRAIRALTLEEFDQQMDAALGAPSLTGVEVTADAALTFSAFFSAVLQISQTVASLPLPVYRRISDREKERADSHPLYKILNRQVGPYTTSFTWRETMTHHALVWGNGRSLKVRDRAGRLIGFVLLNPSRTSMELKDGIPIYVHTNRAGRRIELAFEDVFQLPGIGFDGLQGYSVLRIARESLGLGLALQEFGARFFGQGTNLGGLITRPAAAPKLSPDAAKRLEQDLKQKWEGLKRSHGIIVLEEGSEFEKVGMPLDDAQFLASKQFSIQDVARWTNMPPHKLKDLSRTTYNNIEQEQLSYAVDTVRPWNVRWETSISSWLIAPTEQETYFVEHLMDALLRGDIKTRYDALNTARQNGVINANDWRRMENWNPIFGPAGEAYLVNGNMTPTDKAGQGRSPGQALDSALAAAEKQNQEGQPAPATPAQSEGEAT